MAAEINFGTPSMQYLNDSLTLTEGNDVLGFWQGPGTSPTTNMCITREQPVILTFKWDIQGAFAAFITPDYHYFANLYFEKMGPGAELNIPNSVTPHVQTSALQGYSLAMTIPANTLAAGVYRLVASVTLKKVSGALGLPPQIPLMAFYDMGFLSVYDAQ
jgi:hypothetical protein